MGLKAYVAAWVLELFVLTIVSSDIPPKSLECPSKNWFLDAANYRCLLMVSSPMTYYSAATSCKVLGTEMASISTCDDISLIKDIVNYSMNTTIPVTVWSKYHIVNQAGSFFIADETDNIMAGSKIMGSINNNESNLCVQSALVPPNVYRIRSDCRQKHRFLCEYQLKKASNMIMISPTGLAVMVISMVLMFAVVVIVFLELIVKMRELHTAEPTAYHDEKDIAYEDNFAFHPEKSNLSLSLSKFEIVSISEDPILSTENRHIS